MQVAANIKKIEDRIASACLRCGRKREDVTLMAVTKFQPLSAVDEAWKAGLRHFGESRVQEVVAKFSGAQFASRYAGAELHLLGSLQRNKAKQAVSLFDCIQSLDRESLVAELAKHTAGRAQPLPLLLEFRTGEDSKSGFTGLDALCRAVDAALDCPGLCIRGLMTIAPNTNEEGPVRAAFRQLTRIQAEMQRRYPGGACGVSWQCLSMGMSGDFEAAVEEGSTMLRIGTAIFGERA